MISDKRPSEILEWIDEWCVYVQDVFLDSTNVAKIESLCIQVSNLTSVVGKHEQERTNDVSWVK